MLGIAAFLKNGPPLSLLESALIFYKLGSTAYLYFINQIAIDHEALDFAIEKPSNSAATLPHKQ